MTEPDLEAFRRWSPAAVEKANQQLSVAKEQADRWKPWYCPDSRCDGKPHGDWTWKHCRADQRPPGGDLDWFVWILRGGRGCVAPWTRIYNPETGRHAPVSEISGSTPVQTLKGPATASAPFVKGTAHMWTVTTSRGDQVTVTGEHRFLTPQGWIELASLRTGQLVAVAPRAHRPGVVPSQSASHVGAQSSSRTGEGFLDDCRICLRLHGRLPPTHEGAVQVCPPSQFDADEHIRHCWHGDVPKFFGECNHPCLRCNHRPRSSSSPGEPWALSDLCHDEPWQSGPSRDSYPGPARSRRWTCSDRAAAVAADRHTRLPSLEPSAPHAYGHASDLDRFPGAFDQSSGMTPRGLPKSQVESVRYRAYGSPSGDRSAFSARPGEVELQQLSVVGLASMVESQSPRQWFSETSPLGTDEPTDLLPLVDSFCQIVSIEYSHYGIYYDLTVPDGQHYTAEGIIHHNSGKTRAGSEYTRKMTGYTSRIALVARTTSDVREVLVEGESGVLATSPPGMRPTWEPSKRRLTWPNGCIGSCFTAEEPDRLRGPESGFAWCDEPGHWPLIDDVWSNLVLGLRLGRNPRICATTTPRPTKWMKDVLKDPTTVDVRVSTYANLDNLAPTFRKNVLDRYEGTRLGRQELHGEVLEDVEGALWTQAMIDDDRMEEAPDLERIIVAVDPAGTANARSDETGIIVVGKAGKHFYVLADYSGKYSPLGWANKTASAYREFSADAVVAERNYGGDMVAQNIHNAHENVRILTVHSRRGKKIRAEPIAGLYEQHRGHHVGLLTSLEDEQTSWVPGEGDSPNRVDALVHGVTELMSISAPADVASPVGHSMSNSAFGRSHPGSSLVPRVGGVR